MKNIINIMIENDDNDFDDFFRGVF